MRLTEILTLLSFLQPSPRMAMLCPHMILVSTTRGLHLYRAPQIDSDDGINACIGTATLQPIAAYLKDEPSTGKQIWDSLCPQHHDGHVATYTFTDLEDALLILPGPGQTSEAFVRYVIDGPCSMGNSRAIGCRDFVDMQPMTLQTFTHFTRHHRHPGYMRFGRTSAPSPSLTTSIPLVGWDGRTEDLSWDEQSGKICVISSPFEDRSTRNMLLVDMI